ncbi:hypothetical protein G6F31_019790 [Rhizopus arrhizus]|nr:hypothetical protein G6F31_019790 [Rhizopus arrhizus]
MPGTLDAGGTRNAASSSPRCNSPKMLTVLPLVKRSRMCGKRRVNSGRISGSKRSAALGTAHTRRVPMRPWAASCATSSADCAPSNRRVASPRKAPPAAVSRTPNRSRSNSGAPISASSRLMAMLKGGCVILRRSAARR